MFRPKLAVFTALTISLFSPHISWAQSFAELEARLDQHPSLLSLEFESEANEELAIAAKSLPDPVVSVGINNFPIFDPSFSAYLPTNKSVGFRQQIPSKASRTANAKEELARAKQIDLRRSALYDALRAELIANLYELKRIDDQRDLAMKRDLKYDELVDIIEGEIDAGQPSVFRLAEIEGERAEVARALVELRGQRAQLNARFIDLIGSVPDTLAPEISAQEWSGKAMRFHAVRIAAAQADVLQTRIEQAKAAWKPNWGTQLVYQQRNSGNGGIGSNFDGDDWVSGTLSFSLPLWAGKRQEPRLRAANAQRSAALEQQTAVARATLAQYSSLQSLLDTAEESIDVHVANIAAIETEIADQLITYESGSGTYTPIIDGEIAILKLQAAIVSEQTRLATLAARLNALLVTP
jgi:outer membrane protein TolC